MVILASRPGQLGNMLFLSAHFLSFAQEHNLRVENPAFSNYARYFKGTQRSSFSLSYSLTFLMARVIHRLGFNNKLLNHYYLDWDESIELENILPRLRSRYCFVQGWQFRSNSALKKHKNQIKELFTPLDQHLENIEQLLDPLPDHIIKCGVHVRRGDYKNFMGGKYFFELEEYRNVMKKFQALQADKEIQFIICSNEQLNNTCFGEFNTLPGPAHFVEDLYTLAKCDYIIGPPSTFSMWASFYGDVPLFQMTSGSYIPDSLNAFKSFSL